MPARNGSRLCAAGVLAWCVLAISPAAALDVAVISDLNGSFGSTDYEGAVRRAVTRIVELRPDLVLLTGDMVAGQARPALAPEVVAAMWRTFDAQVLRPLSAAGIPLVPTPGNHDASAYAGFASERAAYAEFWRAHRPDIEFVDDTHFPFYFSFAVGDALFVSLDATVVGPLPAAQRDWVRQALAQPDRDVRQRVVFAHLPLRPFAVGREAEYVDDRHLLALLRRSRVALMLSGHHHAFYPGAADGVALVGQGCLGAGRRRLIGSGDRGPRAVTWLRMGPEGIAVGALVGTDFDVLLPWRDLPARIDSAAGVLDRADLAEAPVTELVGFGTAR